MCVSFGLSCLVWDGPVQGNLCSSEWSPELHSPIAGILFKVEWRKLGMGEQFLVQPLHSNTLGFLVLQVFYLQGECLYQV